MRASSGFLRIRALAGGVAFTLLAAACGSTVASQDGALDAGAAATAGAEGLTDDGMTSVTVGDAGTGAVDDGSTGGFGATTDGAAAGGAGTADSAGAGSSTAGGGTSGSTGGSGSPSGQPSGKSGKRSRGQGPSPSSAPGVTSSTIYVGAMYSEDSGEANAAIGAAGTDPGDARDYYNAAIKDVNARGGVAGRKLKPIYYPISATSSSSIESQYQGACAHFTQDNKIFALFQGSRPLMQECAHKAGALNVSSGFSGAIASTYQRFPGYVEPSSLRLDRIGSVSVTGLKGQGYFDRGAKTGVVSWDEPNYVEAVEKDFKPALTRVGFPATETAYVEPPQNLAGVSDTSAQINAAVLRFRSQGVTHVMILDGPAGLAAGAVITLLFLQSAESQGYRPRYGFNSTNAQSNSTLFLFPKEQLRRARVVGWVNTTDESDTGIRKNRARVRCLKIMRDNGVDIGNVNAQGAAIQACDAVWFLDTAVEAGGDLADVGRAMAGVGTLGSSYASPYTFGTYLTPRQHDGADRIRDSRFEDGCECYRYTSRPYSARNKS